MTLLRYASSYESYWLAENVLEFLRYFAEDFFSRSGSDFGTSTVNANLVTLEHQLILNLFGGLEMSSCS